MCILQCVKKFGILTHLGSSLFEPTILELGRIGVSPQAIFIDGKSSAKDQEIERSRLLPNYKIVELSAMNLNLPLYYVSNHNEDFCIQLIKTLGLDFLVSASTLRILKTEIIKSTPLGVLNCHPGVLPGYRGCTCVEWSILNDDPVGATAHFMGENIDEGPIVETQIMKVSNGDSYRKIRTDMLLHQAKVLGSAVLKIQQDEFNLAALPCPLNGTYHKPISSENLSKVLHILETGHYKSVPRYS